MKIPIRIKEYAVKKEDSRFDLLGGIFNFFNNIKLVFTGKLLTGGHGFIDTQNEIIVVRDVSLLRDETTGEYKFVVTPEGIHQSILEISSNIRE